MNALVRKKKFFLLLVIPTLLGILALFIWRFFDPLMPFVVIEIRKPNEWSIGMMAGPDPLNLSEYCGTNPVFTASDVTDVQARFVADPFIIQRDGHLYMFFEVWNNWSGRGEIGLASSVNGCVWKYEGIVLREPFHMSYPYVFRHENEYYMLPETANAHAVRVYKATEFPRKWSLASNVIENVEFSDPSILHHNGRWWMFVFSHPDVLRLYHSFKLTEGWVEHPKSPVRNDPNSSRCAGRVIFHDGKIIRFAQDIYPTYGNKIRAMEIKTLDEKDYFEKELPESPLFKASGTGWNADGMHQIDALETSPGQWIAVVDGTKHGKRISGTINHPRTVKVE